MPIVDIEFVGDVEAEAQTYAHALGDVFGGQAGTTWVRVRTLPPESYAENASRSPGFRPIFVTVLQRRRPPVAILDQLARDLATTIASISQREVDNVHVIFSEPGAGRVAFGGRLVPE